jgi:hypothetical protein
LAHSHALHQTTSGEQARLTSQDKLHPLHQKMQSNNQQLKEKGPNVAAIAHCLEAFRASQTFAYIPAPQMQQAQSPK